MFSNPVFALLLLLTVVGCTSSAPSLPEIRVITNNNITAKAKTPCLFEYKHHGESFLISGKVKQRGGSSMRFPKWNLAINLDHKLPLAQLPNDNDWILSACYADKTFMRHKLAYDLFLQMGKNNIAPRSAYVTVYMKGHYQGIYLLSERLDASTIRIEKGRSAGAMIFKGPDIFREVMGTPQIPDNYYHQKYPEISKKDYSDHIGAFRSFLTEANDSLFNAQVEDWIDLENLIDWHLILLFTNNTDGVCKNYYLYKVNKNTPFRIAIWDYDHGYGRDGDNEYNMPDKMMTVNNSILFRRLLRLNTSGYRQRLESRWEFLQQKNILTKNNVTRLIQTYTRLLGPELERNAEKWPLKSRFYYDDNTFEQEVALIQQYFDIRIKQMQTNLIVE